MGVESSRMMRPRPGVVWIAILMAATGVTADAFGFGKAADAHGYSETFGIARDQGIPSDVWDI